MWLATSCSFMECLARNMQLWFKLAHLKKGERKEYSSWPREDFFAYGQQSKMFKLANLVSSVLKSRFFCPSKILGE